MLALRGKQKKLVKITRMEKQMICVTEEPPGSGTMRMPLIENGKNVEKFEILQEEQMSFLGE